MAIKELESGYKASITREQFLFYEMRITARLIADGLSDAEVIDAIVNENLLQFPFRACILSMRKSVRGSDTPGTDTGPACHGMCAG